MPTGSCNDLFCKQKSKQPILEKNHSRNLKIHRTLVFWVTPLICVQTKHLILIWENGKHWHMQNGRHQYTCLCMQVQASDFSITIYNMVINYRGSQASTAHHFLLFHSFLSVIISIPLFGKSIDFWYHALSGYHTWYCILHVWENADSDLPLFQESKYGKRLKSMYEKFCPGNRIWLFKSLTCMYKS